MVLHQLEVNATLNSIGNFLFNFRSPLTTTDEKTLAYEIDLERILKLYESVVASLEISNFLIQRE